jgi:hypothetical protein
VYFKGSYKGDIFGSTPYPFGSSWAKVSVQYFIIEYNTGKVKRVTFFSREKQNGFWEYITKTYNIPEYNYYFTRNYLYSTGLKLQAESSASVTSSWSNFAKDNYQHPSWPAKWTLEYIRLHT